MKKSEIKVGVTYHNGKTGRFYSERMVIAEGPEYLLYDVQEDHDCIRYRVVKGRDVGEEGNMTRTAFARWARGIVE